MKTTIRVAAIRSRAAGLPDNARLDHPSFNVDNFFAYVEGNIEKDLKHVDEAGSRGADLVCTVEGFAGEGTYIADSRRPDLFEKAALRAQEIIYCRFGDAARRHRMLIAANHYTVECGNIYNTSTLFSRDGSVAGQYRKVHLPPGEAVAVTPGDTFPVFETDIGLIGFATCYDILISEQFRILALNGADIIVHQSMAWGPDGRNSPLVGDAYLRTRANENSVYLIVANNTNYGGRSCIIDPDGNFLAEAGGRDEGLAFAEFAPDYDRHDPYFYDNYFSDVPCTRARQLLVRRPELYGVLTSPDTYSHKRDKAYKLPTPERFAEICQKLETMDAEARSKYFWSKP